MKRKNSMERAHRYPKDKHSNLFLNSKCFDENQTNVSKRNLITFEKTDPKVRESVSNPFQ